MRKYCFGLDVKIYAMLVDMDPQHKPCDNAWRERERENRDYVYIYLVANGSVYTYPLLHVLIVTKFKSFKQHNHPHCLICTCGSVMKRLVVLV